MANLPMQSQAHRLLDGLRECASGRRRLTLDECWTALYDAEPTLFTAAEKRQVLADRLAVLAKEGAIQLCVARSYDRSEQPPLPRFITLLDSVANSPSMIDAAGFPWRPPLTWAADLDLTQEEFGALQAINSFLRDGGGNRPIVPSQERSLEVLGHEKALDRLSRGRLFAPGRLSWSFLRARRVSPPFAWRRVGTGSILLVIENSATFATVSECLPSDSAVGIVGYGGGMSFMTSVGSITDIAALAGVQIETIVYFGDLDKAGLAIPIGADATAQSLNLPRVQPAASLYELLFAVGRTEMVSEVPREIAEELAMWLPSGLRESAIQHFMMGRRLAQEAVGLERLGGLSGWHTREQLLGQ